MLPKTTRAKRPVLLIVGCGDVGLRVLRLVASRWRVLALTSSPHRVPELRAAGATPLLGNLDDPRTLARLAGLADAVLHLAPPPHVGERDARTAGLIRTLALRSGPRAFVYASTTGVYGDCQGAWIDETRTLAPATARGRRRADAEARLRWAGRAFGWRTSLLRVPGIYALDREGGDPRERVRRGAPVLRAEDDVYTNHIHADDLARACVAALHRGRPQRAYNVSDCSVVKMGDHFDAVADRFGLPRPRRISRAEAAQEMSPMQLSFLSESRRLMNRRLLHELRLTLRYPTVADGLGG